MPVSSARARDSGPGTEPPPRSPTRARPHRRESPCFHRTRAQRRLRSSRRRCPGETSSKLKRTATPLRRAWIPTVTLGRPSISSWITMAARAGSTGTSSIETTGVLSERRRPRSRSAERSRGVASQEEVHALLSARWRPGLRLFGVQGSSRSPLISNGFVNCGRSPSAASRTFTPRRAHARHRHRTRRDSPELPASTTTTSGRRWKTARRAWRRPRSWSTPRAPGRAWRESRRCRPGRSRRPLPPSRGQRSCRRPCPSRRR